MKLYIVIPAYCEENAIGPVIKRLKEKKFENIIVVDDCSKDKTGDVALKAGAIVIRHSINRGAGAATKTGIEYALLQGAQTVITIDADGQHNPDDIDKTLPYATKYDVVIGSRLLDRKNMPLIRKVLNWGGSIITYLLYGIYVKDSQTGFKIFNKKAMEKIDIKFDRYEFCSEVLHEMRKHNLTYIEVPIHVIYTQHSLSKGQTFMNGLKMIYKMILRLFLP